MQHLCRYNVALVHRSGSIVVLSILTLRIDRLLGVRGLGRKG